MSSRQARHRRRDRRRRHLRARHRLRAATARCDGGSLESNHRAGGVIGTLHRDGALYETGPNSALDTTPQIDELLEALGIRGERVDAAAVAATRYIIRDGKLAALPTSPAAFLATSTLRSEPSSVSGANPSFPPRRPTSRSRSPRSSSAGSGPSFSTTRSTRSSRASMRETPNGSPCPPHFRASHALEQRYGSLIKGQFQGARERRRFRANGVRTTRAASPFATACRR
jgi:oxygen-dependent protoporphyrinogen oxidase